VASLQAQHRQIDSLSSLLKTKKNDSSTVDLLNKLAYAYYRVDADSTLYFAQESQALSNKINYLKGEGEAIRLLAIGYWVEGEYLKTIQLSQQAIQIFEKVKDKDGISRCYNTIGLVYYRKKDYVKALSYFEKGLSIDQELNIPKNIAIKLTNIGIIHEAQKDYVKAHNYLFESLKIGEKAAFIEFTLVTMRHIGEVYLKKQQYAEAMLFGNKTLFLAKQLGSEREMTLALILLGKVAIEQKNYQTAEKHLLSALYWAGKTKEKEHSKEVAENLYILFKLKKQDTKALFYHELVQKYQDSLFSEKAEMEIKNLEYSYQLQLKEKEITLLKKDKLLQEQDNKRTYIIMVSLAIIVALVALLALIFFRERQKQQKANILLQQKHNEIIQQQAELLDKKQALEASNQLKNRLFSIIAHDVRTPLNSLRGVLSLITVDGLSIEEIDFLYKDISKQLNNLEGMLSNLLQWSKSQMEGEHNQKEVVVLEDVLEEIVGLLQAMANIKDIQLSYTPTEKTRVKLDVNQIRVVFRNLLTNAIKFTHPQGSVNIRVFKKGSSMIVEIEDTGVGMSEKALAKLFQQNTHFSTKGTDDEKGTGLGLLLVKEFVEKNNAKMSIKSQENVGTIFTIEFPIFVN